MSQPDRQTASPPQTCFGMPSDHGGKDLGVFLPIANGGWILSSTTPRLDGSYDYNLAVARLAEDAGLDFIMSMAKWRGYGGATQHWRHALDSQMLMAALAAVTRRVRVVTTVHPLLQNPAVAAKMIATLDHISHGRAGLNIVTGSYKGEFEQMDAWRANVGHDERYDLAEEWTRIVKRLWTEPAVDHKGRFYTMTDCQSDPKPLRPPFLVCAGTSARGMKFTAERMDAMFAGGRDDAELGGISRTVKALARDAGRRIRTYTMVNLVIAETDAQAQEDAARYRLGFDEEACFGMMRAYGFLDGEIGRENAFVQNARSGFMSAHIIGAPARVAARIAAVLDGCDLDGIMLIFPDYLAALPIFAREIMPAIRARFPPTGTPGGLARTAVPAQAG